ncbi:STN domain-containing protein [Paraflavitalea speifideaquila]|uniref:STN domain-containing protein n=1 Tax=Paraflavitalea speifideaquila TaxID=3076558 RepID=UPI0028EBC050|nr:carboxypeptidase-like regulatory domain-containing protein [Paraflavitalea speifideiaquila]
MNLPTQGGKLNYCQATLMKMPVCFMVAIALLVSTPAISQKITLKGDNLPLRTVFEAIKSQAGYSFVYDDDLIKKALPVHIDVSNASVPDVLLRCFKNQPFTYEVKHKAIVLKEKDRPAAATDPGMKTVESKGDIIATGTVYSNLGEPLVGATVSLKDKSITVNTNNAGKFSITIPGSSGQLKISYVNYTTQEINITPSMRFPIDVTLQLQSKTEDEIVVIGYGTQKENT